MLKAPLWLQSIRWFIIIFMLAYAIISLYPLFWITMTSFKTFPESITWPPTMFPRNFMLDNFRTVFQTPLFMRYFYNSVIYAVVGTLGTVLMSAMAGYAFAKFDFKGKVRVYKSCFLSRFAYEPC